MRREFYDLNKDPIVCPKCHTVLELAAASAHARPDTTTTARAIKPAAEEEVVAPEVADAEFVSLEEADAEAQGNAMRAWPSVSLSTRPSAPAPTR